MTVPKIEIGFEGPARRTAFQLDDLTYGRLDSGVLGIGETLVDLTSRLLSISVRRGRTDDTDPTQTGTASVILRNRDGVLDPLNTSSTLYPGVEPRRTINIYADNKQVFAGFVDDIDLQYDPNGDANVRVTASDGFSRLSLASLGTAGIPVSEQDSGARISSILAARTDLWPGATSIDVGDSTLSAGTATGNVLSYFRAIEQSEGGFLFISADGKLAFRNRNNPAQNPDDLILSDAGGTACTPFSAIERIAGVDDLYNVISADVNDVDYEVSDQDSIDDYGVRSLDLGTLLLSAADTTDRLDYELIRRSNPSTRIAKIEVNQSSTTSGCLKTLDHDLGEAVRVIFSPPGVSQQTQEGVIIAVEHMWTVNASWRTTFGLVARDASPFLILDDVDYGQLGVGVLAF